MKYEVIKMDMGGYIAQKFEGVKGVNDVYDYFEKNGLSEL